MFPGCPSPVSRLAALTCGLLLGACTLSTRSLPEAARIAPDQGYRAEHLGRVPGREAALPGRYVILAFSGGGTRATALAQGVLREMGATPAPGRSDLSLLDAVDMVSSTSGGSVAASNFVLYGPAGYGRLHAPDGFLRHDGIADLVGGVLNPANQLNYAFTSASRIETLPDMFRRTVLGGATFADLRAAAPRHPPLLVLNASDMATGQRFSFTQDQLDRICIDLQQVSLADATAASAAFPIALTPLPLPVHSPCKAQSSAEAQDIMEGFRLQAGFRASAAAYGPGCGGGGRGEVLFRSLPPDRAQALRQWHLLNLDPCGRPLPEDRRLRFVHLQDGGTADNLALSAPLEAITGLGAEPRLATALAAGEVREVVILSVNARSQGPVTLGRDDATPGVVSALLAAINTPIDGRSGGLLAELGAVEDVLRGRFAGASPGQPVPRVRVIPVDFERIADPACREAFQGIATSWTLRRQDTDALQEMASAMLRADSRYLELAAQPADREPGLARARSACQRLQNPGDERPLGFGG
jgi:NTE family protein